MCLWRWKRKQIQNKTLSVFFPSFNFNKFILYNDEYKLIISKVTMCFISWVSKHRLINSFNEQVFTWNNFFSSISKICYLTFLSFSNGSNSSNKINKIILNIGFHHSWFLNDATFLIWLDDFSTITNELKFSIDRSPVAKRVRIAIQFVIFRSLVFKRLSHQE